MKLLKPPLIAIGALGVLLLAHLAWALPALPARLATHFDAAGRPNGWMSHSGLILFEGLLLAFMAAVIVGVAFAVPPRMMNVPNRHYWFAPEREAEGMARLRRQLLWFLVGMEGFLIAMNQLLFAANAGPGAPHLSNATFGVMIAGALIALGAWLVRLAVVFRLPRGVR